MRSFSRPEAMEEEQRLLYVAVTRASKRLVMTMNHDPADLGSFERLCRFIEVKNVLELLDRGESKAQRRTKANGDGTGAIAVRAD